MDGDYRTIKSSDVSSQPGVQHTPHVIHMVTVRMVLPNAWSLKSLKRPRWSRLTPRLEFSFEEKQLTPQSISIRDHRLKAWKDTMTTMAIQCHTKHQTKCCIDLEKLCLMPTAMKYRIKTLSSTYNDWDATPVDSFPKLNSVKDRLALEQRPV